MINKLTEKQESQIKVYVDKWLAVGRRTAPGDKSQVEAALKFFYEDIMKLQTPTTIIHTDSPSAAIAAINKAKKNKKAEYSPCRSNWNISYYGLYDYILNEIFPEKVQEFSLFVEMCKHLQSFHQIYLFEGAAFVAEFPETLLVDAEGRLHCDSGPALRYKDNTCTYALDGVLINEDILAWVLDKSQASASNIMALENVEQRLVAMKYFGAQHLMGYLNAKEISSKGSEYVLYEVKLEGSKEKLLKMKNPSEDKQHYEFVPPEIQTVAMALAWRIGWDSFREPVAKT